jgi:hypothetical protein
VTWEADEIVFANSHLLEKMFPQSNGQGGENGQLPTRGWWAKATGGTLVRVRASDEQGAAYERRLVGGKKLGSEAKVGCHAKVKRQKGITNAAIAAHGA